MIKNAKSFIPAIVLIYFSSILLPVNAQNTFQRNYGFGNEIGYKIVEVNNGFVIAGTYNFGNTSDMLITRTDLLGNVLWSKKYGGIWSDDVFAMDITSDGGYILAGYTFSFGGLLPNDYECVLLVKIDSTGSFLWSKILELGGVDVAHGIKETFDHGFILTGFSSPNTFLVKTDSLGIIEWSNTYDAPNGYIYKGRTVIQKRDTGYVVLGTSINYVAPDTAALLFIVNPTGNTISSHHFQIMNSSVTDDITYPYDLIQNQNGDLLIAGGCGGNFQNLFYAYAPFILKTDSAGNYLGGKTYSLNSGDGRAYSVRERPAGGYIIGGTMGNYYPMMIETDAGLNTNWCYYYGNFNAPPGLNAGFGLDAIPLTGGGYALTGYRTFSTPGIFMTVVKTDSSGQSGCNQGIPIFSGNAANFTHSHSLGAPSSVNNATQMSVTLDVLNVVLPDSIICMSVSVGETIQPGFEIYPNPATDYLNINFPITTNKDLSVEILDISGKIILHSTPISDETRLDLSRLSEGIYVLKISDRKNPPWMKKFVKM